MRKTSRISGTFFILDEYMSEGSFSIEKISTKYWVQLAAILVLYACYHALAEHVFFEGFLFGFAKLNRAVAGTVPYETSSIILSSLRDPFFSLALAAFYAPLIIKRKQLKGLRFDKTSRIIVFIAAATLAWELSTYDYNYYLAHAFYFDRVALVVLAILLLRYPLLSPLFIAFAFVYRSQFNYPVDGFPLFDKRLLYDVLIMFMAHTYLRLFVPAFKAPLLYFILCIVGANYFSTGLKKLSMQPYIYGWVACNNPGDLFANVHYRGWLTNLDDNNVLSIATVLGKLKIPLQAIVLLIELSGLFMLRSYRLTRIFLIGFTLMHAGIFILGSMLFWKWMVIDITLLCLLIYGGDQLRAELFTKRGFIASLIIIPLSLIWLKPITIGWYDTPVNQYFTYEVTTADGKIYELDKNEMNPYHQWFQYDNFRFLVNKPSLRITGFGYTNKYATVQAIRQAGPEGFAALEARDGENLYDPVKKEGYEQFIKTYFANRNKRLGISFIPAWFKAPNHLYSAAKDGGYNNAVPVSKFRVFLNQVYTRDGLKTVMNKALTDEIIIPN